MEVGKMDELELKSEWLSSQARLDLDYRLHCSTLPPMVPLWMANICKLRIWAKVRRKTNANNG